MPNQKEPSENSPSSLLEKIEEEIKKESEKGVTKNPGGNLPVELRSAFIMLLPLTKIYTNAHSNVANDAKAVDDLAGSIEMLAINIVTGTYKAEKIEHDVKTGKAEDDVDAKKGKLERLKALPAQIKEAKLLGKQLIQWHKELEEKLFEPAQDGWSVAWLEIYKDYLTIIANGNPNKKERAKAKFIGISLKGQKKNAEKSLRITDDILQKQQLGLFQKRASLSEAQAPLPSSQQQLGASV